MIIDPRVIALCDEFGIKIVPANVYPNELETRAPGTLGKILAKHGEGHLRIVLSTLTETKGGIQALLDETAFWAVSDLVLARPDWIEERLSDWLSVWDEMPFGPMMAANQDIRGVVPLRPALAGACYTYINDFMEPAHAAHGTPLGRKWRRQSKADRLVLGKVLLLASQALDNDQLAILRTHLGLSDVAAQHCVRRAQMAA
jgi:hypothetical protein